jgi:hypothetical protein
LEDRAKGGSGQCSSVWLERVTVVFCSISVPAADVIRRVKTIPRLFPLLLSAALVSCADVQERSQIVGARTGTPLTASVGDTVLRVSRQKNLPNIAGKADIFGRMTPTGVETVQYLGVKDGMAIFRRRTVDVETGATTMNSTPLIIPNTATTTSSGSVNIYGPSGYGHGSYSGTSTASLPPTVIPAASPQHRPTPAAWVSPTGLQIIAAHSGYHALAT